MGRKTLYGLLIGLGLSIFVLANSHGGRVPILAFPLFYVYGIGFIFGWEKMKDRLAHACGVAASVDYWLLIGLFFRRNGILWGLGLFLLYLGFAITFGIWYGLFIFCSGIVKKFFPSTQVNQEESDSDEQTGSSWMVWGAFVVIFCGIGLVAYNYWTDTVSGKGSDVAGARSSYPGGVYKESDRKELRQSVAQPSSDIVETKRSTPKVPEWKKIFSLQPSSSAYGLLAGQWQGEYLVGRKERNLHLQVTQNKAGKAVAIFTFDTSKKAKVKDIGQFYLVCKYNPEENNYHLIAADWLKKLGGYRMVNMRGSINKRKFTGYIVDMNSNKEIGTFQLVKIRD